MAHMMKCGSAGPAHMTGHCEREFNGKPVLVIMAAGMGSRFGGLKQIEPVSGTDEIILDFSLFDAKRAGFESAVIIIKRESEEDFRRLIENKAGKYMSIEFAYQDISDIPEGFSVPEGRSKPWGTAHAVLASRHLIDGPFCVINSDDYYGPEAFRLMYDFLDGNADITRAGSCNAAQSVNAENAAQSDTDTKNSTQSDTDTENSAHDNASTGAAYDDTVFSYSMVGYEVKNTLTENGHVSRGVCDVGEDGYLRDIVERTKLMHHGDGIAYTEDDGASWTAVPPDATVSMNFWGFTPSILRSMEEGLPAFLNDTAAKNPLKGEYLLPECVDKLIKAGRARVRVLRSPDRWYGVTYKEDKEGVVTALQALKDSGLYPQKLWD